MPLGTVFASLVTYIKQMHVMIATRLSKKELVIYDVAISIKLIEATYTVSKNCRLIFL